MNNYESTLRSRAAYDAVVNILQKRFGQLPETGIIAGQAVASAIYDVLGISKNGPYNDLDVYVEIYDLPDGYSQVEESTGVKAISHGVVSAGQSTSFDGIFQPMEKNGYFIYGAGVDANNSDINYISISMSCDRNQSEEKVILEGFDLNCCMSALDTANKQLVVNDAFLEFLESREIKIVNYFTPIHTIVRAVKKAKELDFCTFDQETAISNVSTIRKYIQLQEENRSKHRGFDSFSGHVFSDVYKDRFEQHSDVLGNHFTLATKMVPFYDMKSDRRFEKKGDRQMFVINPVKWDGSLLNTINAFIKCTKVSRGGDWYDLEDDIFYIKDIMDLHAANDWRIVAFNDLLDLAATSDKTMADGFRFLFSVLMTDKAELIGLMTNDQKMNVASLMQSNSTLGRIGKLDLPPESLCAMLDNLVWMRDTGKSMLIGELVNKIHPNYDFVIRDEDHYEKMAMFMSYLIAPDFREKTDLMIKQRIDHMGLDGGFDPRFANAIASFDSGNYRIGEILTVEDLYEEAGKHHCTANAFDIAHKWNAINSGKAFIFSIDDVTGELPGNTFVLGIDKLYNFCIDDIFSKSDSQWNQKVDLKTSLIISSFSRHCADLLMKDLTELHGGDDYSVKNIVNQNIGINIANIQTDFHVPRVVTDYDEAGMTM